MEWHERMNKAVNYMEEHLCEDIDMKKISSAVGQSPLGFQRTFSIVTDMSVYEYIRRRRMTLAAFELQNNGGQVIDIAMKYCYESPEAFARAFKEIHGVSPSAARKKGMALCASAHGSKIHAICDYKTVDGDGNFPYMLFAFNKPECNTAGFTVADVPAATWAVFKSEKHTEAQTSETMQQLIGRVYTEWLPTASYNKIDGYELELYWDTGDGMCYCETWIRVSPK